MIVQFKTKVKLFSEDDLEILDQAKKLNLPQVEGKWVTRMEAYRSEEIFKITRYSKEKSLLTFYDPNKNQVLVYEPFDEAVAKWEAAEEVPVSVDNEDVIENLDLTDDPDLDEDEDD